MLIFLLCASHVRTVCNALEEPFICKSHDQKRPQRLASNDQPARPADHMRGLRPPSSFLEAKKLPRPRPSRPTTVHSIDPRRPASKRQALTRRSSCSATPSVGSRKPPGS